MQSYAAYGRRTHRGIKSDLGSEKYEENGIDLMEKVSNAHKKHL